MVAGVNKRSIWVGGILLLICSLSYSDLYRYQDSKGRWHFTDEPPTEHKKQAEALELRSVNRKRQARPTAERVWRNEQYELIAKNPLPVPIQYLVRWKGEDTFFENELLKANQEVVVKKEKRPGKRFDFYYLIGEPIDKPKNLVIPPPYSAKKSYQISQGFNGRFSHTGRGNRFAIDIAMPIGSAIHAVKDGIVADATDQFSIGDAANYFLDKANHVTVMHEDGSYAVYAHILHGSLEVGIGDTIKVGQKIARSGNTGYSTGPHLHFVIRYNSGRGGYSVPFKFQTANGAVKPVVKSRYQGIATP